MVASMFRTEQINAADVAADALGAIWDEAWTRLEDGATRRTSAFHLPVVASLSRSGDVDARVMVLRHADRTRATLRFHTDARAPKVAQWTASPGVTVVAYDADAAIQLRLTGTVRIECDGPESDKAWQSATAFARRCYTVVDAPGTFIPAPGSGLPPQFATAEPDADALMAARRNFAVVLISVNSIDWLSLAHTGHRRAIVGPGGQGRWVIP